MAPTSLVWLALLSGLIAVLLIALVRSTRDHPEESALQAAERIASTKELLRRAVIDDEIFAQMNADPDLAGRAARISTGVSQ